MFRYAMSFLFAAALMSSPVLAGGGGGGGAKKDATIKVTHDVPGAPPIVAIADPSAALRSALTGGTATVRQVTGEGGIIIRAGATGTLKVRAGNVPLWGSVITNESTGALGEALSATVPVAKGKTARVNASSLLD